MLRFAPTAALLTLAASCSFAASHYGNRIVLARSAAAAPLAAPFLLSAMGAASGVALGAAALCDAVAPERRSSRRRSA